MKLLVVEDEQALLQTIGEGLRLDGYYVDLAPDGETALDYICGETYDLIILDLNLPDISGFDILKELNARTANVKVLILTANADIEHKVEGFELGASDYLTKPFIFQELEVRVQALLRRQFLVVSPVMTCGALELDTTKRIFRVNGEPVALTKKETAIMEYLMLNQDRIVTSEDLLAHAWDSEVNYFSNSIRVHLTSLRKKIKQVLGYNPIINKVGEGYYLQP